MAVDADNYVLKFRMPEYYVGLTYDKLDLDDYGLKIVAATRPTVKTNILGISHNEPAMIDISTPGLTAEADDTITVIGPAKGFKDLYRKINS